MMQSQFQSKLDIFLPVASSLKCVKIQQSTIKHNPDGGPAGKSDNCSQKTFYCDRGEVSESRGFRMMGVGRGEVDLRLGWR